MPTINYDELEDWADRVMQELQEFCDDAQEAAGNPDGEDQLPGVRALMEEYERISKGLPAWQARAEYMPGDSESLLDKI